MSQVSDMFYNVFPKITQLWDIVKKYGRARQVKHDCILRRMRFACWIKRATGTPSEYVIRIAFLMQQWLHERVTLTYTLPVQFSVCMPWPSIWRNHLSDFYEIRYERACRSFVKIGSVTHILLHGVNELLPVVLIVLGQFSWSVLLIRSMLFRSVFASYVKLS